MKISIEEAKNIEVEGIGNLQTIIQHYLAMPLLIDGIDQQKNRAKVLKDWDRGRSLPIETLKEIKNFHKGDANE